VKDRWFTLVATIALALGIGVNATVFTFVNAVLIRSLPFDQPDRIVSLGTRDARDREGGVSFKDYEDWRRSARSFTGLAAFGNTVMNVSDRGRAGALRRPVHLRKCLSPHRGAAAPRA
jgi:hypothetical protein